MKLAFGIGHRACRVSLFSFLALSLSAASLSAQTPNADLLLLNAHVITMNDKQPSAQAVAIRGDRIVWVGNSDEGKAIEQGEPLDLGFERGWLADCLHGWQTLRRQARWRLDYPSRIRLIRSAN